MALLSRRGRAGWSLVSTFRRSAVSIAGRSDSPAYRLGERKVWGVDESLDDLLRQAYPRALSFAAYLTGSRVDAEDVVQEALERTLRRVRGGHDVANLNAYLRRSIVNAFLTRHRRRVRERVGGLDERSSASAAPVIELRRDLAAALGALPPRQRVAIVARFYLDMSERDAAAAMGCSVGTVKALASRGLAALREAHPELATKSEA